MRAVLEGAIALRGRLCVALGAIGFETDGRIEGSRQPAGASSPLWFVPRHVIAGFAEAWDVLTHTEFLCVTTVFESGPQGPPL